MRSRELQPSSPNLDGKPSMVVGRYELATQLARGGIATVYLGRLRGGGGLQRTVAIKRLHAQFRTDGDFSTMFLDEARVAMRVRHPNVIHAVDVVLHEDELFIVMEYVEGASLSQLLRDAGKTDACVPLPIASSIMTNVLHGLHAAHTARDERGEALGIIHRDVSPQNVLVGTDGVARVLDFGIAKTVNQAHVTRANETKGKLTYMPPEQLLAKTLTPKADLFSAGIVLWEVLTGHRLFYGDNDGAIVRSVLENPIPPPSSLNPAVSAELDALVLRALERDPDRRFATADEMAVRLEEIVPPASPRQVGVWVRTIAEDDLRKRANLVARVEEMAPLPLEDDQVVSGARLVVRPRRRGRTALLAMLGLVALAGAAYGVRSFAKPRAAEARRVDTDTTSSATNGPLVSTSASAELPAHASTAPSVEPAPVHASAVVPAQTPKGVTNVRIRPASGSSSVRTASSSRTSSASPTRTSRRTAPGSMSSSPTCRSSGASISRTRSGRRLRATHARGCSEAGPRVRRACERS